MRTRKLAALVCVIVLVLITGCGTSMPSPQLTATPGTAMPTPPPAGKLPYWLAEATGCENPSAVELIALETVPAGGAEWLTPSGQPGRGDRNPDLLAGVPGTGSDLAPDETSIGTGSQTHVTTISVTATQALRRSVSQDLSSPVFPGLPIVDRSSTCETGRNRAVIRGAEPCCVTTHARQGL